MTSQVCRRTTKFLEMEIMNVKKITWMNGLVVDSAKERTCG